MREYFQPDSLASLLECLGRAPENSRILAGGTDLMVRLREDPAEESPIISLCDVPELRAIRRNGDVLVLGAMVTHAAACEDDRIKQWFYALHMACSQVGSQQIRNKGTLGGNLCSASPAGDILPCVFLYGTSMEILRADGKRKLVPAEEFLIGRGKTALEPGEILAALRLPIREGRKSAFVKIGLRREVSIAQLSLAMSWKEDTAENGDLLLRDPEAFLGAADVRPVRLNEVKEVLEGKPFSEENAALLAAGLRERIRGIRENRKTPPRLKITEAERMYKERASAAAVYDMMEIVRGLRD